MTNQIIDAIGNSRGYFDSKQAARKEIKRLGLIGAGVWLIKEPSLEPSDCTGYSDGCDPEPYED